MSVSPVSALHLLYSTATSARRKLWNQRQENFCPHWVFGSWLEGHLDGSVVERLPWAQVVIPGALRSSPVSGSLQEPASPSASLCVSFVNK